MVCAENTPDRQPRDQAIRDHRAMSVDSEPILD